MDHRSIGLNPPHRPLIILFMNGLIVLNKPGGVSSRDAVDQVIRWFLPPLEANNEPRRGEQRVHAGHAGTLDPAATGVLVVCLGQATRLVEFVQRMTKTYRAVVRLGASSDTDDADGSIRPHAVANPPTLDAVAQTLASFVGMIQQVPPAHSAARINGHRAYLLARKGAPVELAPRPVRINEIKLLAYRYPLLEIEVDCGKGTYIRSVARDLGERLGCGGLLEKLERKRIGPFHIEEALPMTATAEQASQHVLPLHLAMAEQPRWNASPAQVTALRQGRRLVLAEPIADQDAEIAVFEPDGTLAAVALWSPASRTLRPIKVFAWPRPAPGAEHRQAENASHARHPPRPHGRDA
jgi:tRNA pseudouridine55 synthase